MLRRRIDRVLPVEIEPLHFFPAAVDRGAGHRLLELTAMPAETTEGAVQFAAIVGDTVKDQPTARPAQSDAVRDLVNVTGGRLWGVRWAVGKRAPHRHRRLPAGFRGHAKRRFRQGRDGLVKALKAFFLS